MKVRFPYDEDRFFFRGAPFNSKGNGEKGSGVFGQRPEEGGEPFVINGCPHELGRQILQASRLRWFGHGNLGGIRRT